MAEPTPNFFTDGEGYERHMGRWSQLAGDIFLDWLALPRGLHCLDVGCGNGAFTERLIARCAPAEVQGIDPSEGQLAYARTRPGTRAARFQQGDAQALPFTDATFDAVTMALAITFVPDPAKGVAEMARVVRPGGIVATYMWDVAGRGFPLRQLYGALGAMKIQTPMAPNMDASGAEQMQSLWQGAGLEGVELRQIEIQVTYADFNDYWESNTVASGAAASRIRTLPAEQLERLKASLRDGLPADAQGRISYPARANAVKGRRAA
jgi:ubiquinone/menaquinone biosynthesis C-methylase UbiE